MRTTPVLALAALLAGLTLSACDSGGEPADPTAPWTPTGRIESPPTPTESTGNPLTEAPPDETARQFIRRWVALGDRMQATGETEGYLGVVGPDCSSCHELARRLEKIYRQGGSVEGGESEVVGTRREDVSRWTVTIDSQPSVIRETKTAAAEELPGGRYQLDVLAVEFDGRWILADYSGIAP